MHVNYDALPIFVDHMQKQHTQQETIMVQQQQQHALEQQRMLDVQQNTAQHQAYLQQVHVSQRMGLEMANMQGTNSYGIIMPDEEDEEDESSSPSPDKEEEGSTCVWSSAQPVNIIPTSDIEPIMLQKGRKRRTTKKRRAMKPILLLHVKGLRWKLVQVKEATMNSRMFFQITKASVNRVSAIHVKGVCANPRRHVIRWYRTQIRSKAKC